MAPFDVVLQLGKFLGYMVYLLVGVAFGAVLEMSGFGDSRKLSAQFYFRDMTVLKVMFTAIVVAMALIFAFSSLGWLEFNRLYVNPTYLLPGIIGGFIMGFGFIIGGFCPGTSMVAVATMKLDGIFFFLGLLTGVFFFGESVSLFVNFHNSNYLGRFILPELFGVSTGLVVFLVVLMALAMFYWAEIAEAFFGRKIPFKKIKKLPDNRAKIFASAGLVFLALFVMFSGQPTAGDKWERLAQTEAVKLQNREVYIHPAELLEAMNDPTLYTRLLDFRTETDYNLFHLENARRVTFDQLQQDIDFFKEMINLPDNTVVVAISNDEAGAARAYKLLRGLGVLNVYILEGGINNWLHFFPPDPTFARELETAPPAGQEKLAYLFSRAVGENVRAANPGIETIKENNIEFNRKIKVQKKKLLSGGCG